MLTIYTVVKGFVGEFTHIQRNAVQSWQVACPGAEIILFGDDEPGAREEAKAFGSPILPIERNEKNAPLITQVIDKANEVARGDIRCLINADIILESRFAEAVATIAGVFDTFLFITQRRNVKVDTEIDFWAGWPEWLTRDAGTPANRSSIDFFCYRGDWLARMPAFGMGRTSWDNWIVGKARQEKVPVVDGSAFTVAWHQNHKKITRQGEIEANRAMLWAEQAKELGTLLSATHHLSDRGTVLERNFYHR